MNTPADKPDLPAPDDIDYRMGGEDVHWYHAETVRRLLADERRKALEEAITAIPSHDDEGSLGWMNANRIRALIDRKEPTK